MNSFLVKLIKAAALSHIEKAGRAKDPTLSEVRATFFAHEILQALEVN